MTEHNDAHKDLVKRMPVDFTERLKQWADALDTATVREMSISDIEHVGGGDLIADLKTAASIIKRLTASAPVDGDLRERAAKAIKDALAPAYAEQIEPLHGHHLQAVDAVFAILPARTPEPDADVVERALAAYNEVWQGAKDITAHTADKVRRDSMTAALAAATAGRNNEIQECRSESGVDRPLVAANVPEGSAQKPSGAGIPGRPDREAVAKIIEPIAFREYERNKTGGWRAENGRLWADVMYGESCDKAREKATTILALYPAAPSDAERQKVIDDQRNDWASTHLELDKLGVPRDDIVNELSLADRVSLFAARRPDAEAVMEACAKLCEDEAEKCLSDIVEGDEIGKREANARAGALLTAACDIRAIPPAPARGGEITLEPGWLGRDIERAAKKVAEYEGQPSPSPATGGKEAAE